MSSTLDDDFNENSEKLPFATIWTRAGAAILDSLLFIIPSILIVYNLIDWKIVELHVVLNLLYIFYKPLMEWKYGATIGKMAVKIKVVTTDFKEINLQQSLNRFVIYFASYFMSLLAGVGLFYMDNFAEAQDMLSIIELQKTGSNQGIDQVLSIAVMVSCFVATLDIHKQTLHDKIAGTYVVSTKER